MMDALLLGTYIPTGGHGFVLTKAVGPTPLHLVEDLARETTLHYAACSGDFSEVKRLLYEEGCDPLTKDRTGALPLHYACAVSQNLEIVKLLLSKGERALNHETDIKKLNVLNRKVCGFTPLHVASYCGNFDIVKYLIDQDECKISAETSDGNTALHFSCVAGHLDITESLIEHDANVHCTNKLFNTPLHCASCSGHLNIVQMLVSKYSCNLNNQNSYQATPLHLACEMGELEIVNYLTVNGCDIHLRTKQNNSSLHIACRIGHLNIVKLLTSQKLYDLREGETSLHCEINLQNERGNTPIHLACQNGHLDIVNLLTCHKQCDLNTQNENKSTPLHLACKEGNFEIARLLIEKGCDIYLKNKWGNAPIHVACEGGHSNIINLIISHMQCARNLNVQNEDESTPLHLACKEGNFEIARLLIEKGCDIYLKNKWGNAPIHVACEGGHSNIINLIISHMQCARNLNVQNEDESTPLHLACQDGHFEIARLLIEKGCDINLKNKSGKFPVCVAYSHGHARIVALLMCQKQLDPDANPLRGTPTPTALHLACQHGYLDMAILLSDSESCDLNNQDNDDKTTPLHLACQVGHFEIAKLLIERGCDVNLKNKSGNTPLHDACKNGKKSQTYTVIYSDADTKNSPSKTTLSFASCNYLDTVKALLATGKVDPTARDTLGRTAAELTNDYDIVNKISQYAKSKLKFEGQHPLGTFIQVFVTGNSSAGKTTLIEVLCREATQLMRILPKQIRIISSVQSQTAGIIPREFFSKTFGSVVIHDFAGQFQYYSSHSAVVENSVLSSAPLFLVVVKLNESNNLISERLSFWLSFIENHCAKAITLPHVVVVGSHKDTLKALGKSLEEITSVVKNVFPTSLHFAGFVALDCRKLASHGLDELRSIITRSCLALREGQSIYFGCHALYAFLRNNFKENICCKVSDIASTIRDSDVLLPQTASGLVELLSAISDKGLMFLLKNSSNPEDSWVIFQKGMLISQINGTMFAPEKFKEHCDFATSTGVVPLSKIKAAFPKHNPDMITNFLVHLEFCQRIQDDVTLRVINASDKDSFRKSVNDSEEYFLFPALISVDRPSEGIWESEAPEEYRCGWYFHCTQARQFLNSRFLHVLLLRLAFSFALAPVSPPSEDSVVLTRRCSMWKNGIQWLSTSGVATIVEVPEQNRSVIVLMQCPQNKVMSCAKLRSAVIQKVLVTKKDCCPKVVMDEFLIHPSELTFPLEDVEKLHHFSLNDISTVVLSNQPEDTYVIDKTGKKKIVIKDLLGFEPYLQIGQPSISKLFSTDTASTHVQELHLLEVAKQLPVYTTIPAYPTYGSLREAFNCFSIFCGRDSVDLDSSPPQPVTNVPVATGLDPATDDHLSTLLQDIDKSELGPISLLVVRTELKEVVPVWFNLGLALGLHQHTLESIQMQYREDVEQCLTESLTAWLQSRDSATAPSWRTVAEALLSPMVNQHRLAVRIADSHGRSGSTSQEPSSITSDGDPVVQDVDDSKLDERSLHSIVAAVVAPTSYFPWFNVGLALGLYYRTLKVIQSKYSDDNECLRDTLAAWLRQKDEVPHQGLPSWRSLTRALAHPLVDQRGLAEEIARKHKRRESSLPKEETTQSASPTQQSHVDELVS